MEKIHNFILFIVSFTLYQQMCNEHSFSHSFLNDLLKSKILTCKYPPEIKSQCFLPNTHHTSLQSHHLYLQPSIFQHSHGMLWHLSNTFGVNFYSKFVLLKFHSLIYHYHSYTDLWHVAFMLFSFDFIPNNFIIFIFNSQTLLGAICLAICPHLQNVFFNSIKITLHFLCSFDYLILCNCISLILIFCSIFLYAFFLIIFLIFLFFISSLTTYSFLYFLLQYCNSTQNLAVSQIL